MFVLLVKDGRTESSKRKPMPIIYKEIKPDHGYRIDLMVEEKVVVEING